MKATSANDTPFATKPTRAKKRPHFPRTASSALALVALNGLTDADRRPERHHPEQPQDRRVSHPHTAVRNASRKDLGRVRPVDPDEPSPWPVRQRGRPRVQPERAWTVRRRVVAGELLADVELAARGRRARLADAYARREHGSPALVQRRAEAAQADHHPRVDLLEARESPARHPAGRAVRQDGEPDPHPCFAVAVLDRVQHEDRVAVELRRAEGDRGNRARRARWAGPRHCPVPHEGPAVGLRRTVAERVAIRIDAGRRARSRRRLVRWADPDHERSRRAPDRQVGGRGERDVVDADLTPRRRPRVRRARRVSVDGAQLRALRRSARRSDPDLHIRRRGARGERHEEHRLRSDSDRGSVVGRLAAPRDDRVRLRRIGGARNERGHSRDRHSDHRYAPECAHPGSQVSECPARASEDCDRRAQRHQARQPSDGGIRHAHAAVGHPAGEDLRLVRAVNPDEAAAGPVGQHRRARVRSEGERAVDGVGEPGDPLSDVELARRRRPVGLAHADPCPEDRPALLVERRREQLAVDHEVRPDLVVRAERRARDPAGLAVREERQPHTHPVLAVRVDLAAERLDEVRRSLGRVLVQAHDRLRTAARPRARGHVRIDLCPAGHPVHSSEREGLARPGRPVREDVDEEAPRWRIRAARARDEGEQMLSDLRPGGRPRDARAPAGPSKGDACGKPAALDPAAGSQVEADGLAGLDRVRRAVMRRRRLPAEAQLRCTRRPRPRADHGHEGRQRGEPDERSLQISVHHSQCDPKTAGRPEGRPARLSLVLEAQPVNGGLRKRTPRAFFVLLHTPLTRCVPLRHFALGFRY